MPANAPGADDGFDVLDINSVCNRSKTGRSFVYDEIRAGRLVARKFGRLTRVLRADFDAWLASAPPISAAPRNRTPGPNRATELPPPSAAVNVGDDRRAKPAGPTDRPESGRSGGRPALHRTNAAQGRRVRPGAHR
jgi:excisionase family DNA binding protein